MRWLVLVALIGCKFAPGSLRQDGGLLEEAWPVSDVLDAGGNCYAQWFDGTIRFGTPEPLTEANSPLFDRDPFLTADELTYYVSSGRTGSMGNTVWVATRANRSSPFSTPIVASAFESADNETKLSISADGLFAVIGSDRDAGNSVDVWETSRDDVDDPWPTPLSRDHVMQVNTPEADHDPMISADGLRLYLAGSNGSYQYIAVATRPDRTANFSAPTELTELTSTMGDADPSPTPDERILLFASNRTSVGAPNVWFATRATSTGAFDTPQMVPDINTDLPEGDPHLSSDGCRIYFGRNLGAEDWDVFVATALPLV